MRTFSLGHRHIAPIAVALLCGVLLGCHKAPDNVDVDKEPKSDLTLQLTGRVVQRQDEDDVPVALADIVLVGEAFRSTALSDVDGKFAVETPANLKAGTTLYAWSEDLQLAASVSINSREEPLRVTLEPVDPVHGTVVDTDMKPIADAAVCLQSTADPSLGALATTTDENGSFTLLPAMPAPYFIQAVSEETASPRLSSPLPQEIELVVGAIESWYLNFELPNDLPPDTEVFPLFVELTDGEGFSYVVATDENGRLPVAAEDTHYRIRFPDSGWKLRDSLVEVTGDHRLKLER